MAKAPTKSDPEPTQAEPTQPRPVNDEGRTLDEHGLPLGGPARVRALAGRPDPRDAADAVADAPAPDTGANAPQQD